MSWDLIADIGGTNTRLARFQNSDIDAQTTLETGGAGSILSAISHRSRGDPARSKMHECTDHQ